MKALIIGLVPFLGLLSMNAAAHEQWNEVVAVTVQRPQPLELQGDGSHRLFYKMGQVYRYHPNREAIRRELEGNVEMCVLRDVLPEVVRMGRAKFNEQPARIQYQQPQGTAVLASAKNFATKAETSGEPLFMSRVELRDPNAEDRSFALICLSRRPFNATVYSQILGDSISVVPQ